MVIYLAMLILPALVTGLFLLHFGKKEDNKPKRTAGLILLILGVSAMIWPIDVSRISIRRDIPVGFVATLAITLMANYFFTKEACTINWIEGIALLLMGFAYLLLTMLKNNPQEEVEDLQAAMPWGKTILAIVAGIVGLYVGGELVSRNAQILAKNWGMSESTIGLTVVATATSPARIFRSTRLSRMFIDFCSFVRSMKTRFF